MKHVSIKEAKDRLTSLATEAQNGERIVITRHGKPVAHLGPVSAARRRPLDYEALARWKEERGLDRLAGPIPPDFDDPLPEDFLIRPTY